MDKPTTGQLLAEAQRLIGAAPLESAAYVLMTGFASSLSDIPGWERAGIYASTAATLALGYMLVVAMVEKGRLAEGNRARFWTYFGLGILTTIGIVLGSILLLVPGIFLWVRWTAAYGFIAADGSKVTEAMRQSFEATDGIAWATFAALLIPLALIVGASVSIAVWTWETDVLSWPVSLVLNLAISLAGLLTTGIGLAVYSLRHGRTQDFGEVFA